MDKHGIPLARPPMTLRALKPYLVTYRLFGLIPARFGKESDSLSPPRRSLQSRRLRWDWYRVYSAIVLVMVVLFLLKHVPLPSVADHRDESVADKLEAVHHVSYCINVLVIITICFAYLGRRLCRLVERMIRCEKELVKLGCSTTQVGRLPYYCWAIFAMGIVATFSHEFLFCMKRMRSFHIMLHHSSPNQSLPETVESINNQTYQGIRLFNLIFAPFAAGIRPFVDYSVIQLSLILSCYQRILTGEMEHWSSLGLKAKERLRLTYWNVQSVIKEADEIFSPAVLISTLSCVGELVVHINMAFRKETDVHAPDDGLHRQLAMANACSTIYIALRFMATCFFAERVNQERQRSLRCLHEQSNEEFWAYDLELLVTKRFVQQLTLPLGFTGCGFFTLGKRFFIGMCGTILTYEIVLLDMAKSKLGGYGTVLRNASN